MKKQKQIRKKKSFSRIFSGIKKTRKMFLHIYKMFLFDHAAHVKKKHTKLCNEPLYQSTT